MEKIVICPKCQESRTIEDFGKRGKYRVSACKACTVKAARVWNQNNPEKVREHNRRSQLKKNYKLTLEQYQELIKSGCAVCGSFETLCIDHDHACCPGEITCGSCVRGVLCHRHNKALGWVRDSVEELESLIGYLNNPAKHGKIST